MYSVFHELCFGRQHRTEHLVRLYQFNKIKHSVIEMDKTEYSFDVFVMSRLAPMKTIKSLSPHQLLMNLVEIKYRKGKRGNERKINK